MLLNLRKWAKRTLLAGLTIAAFYTPTKLYSHDIEPIEPTPIVHVVEEGDYLSNIAKNQLVLEGESPNLSEIIEKTDSLASMNNKGTIAEYPWHDGYDCSTKDERDPNCIYPGDEIILDYEISNTSISSTTSNNYDSNGILLGIMGLAGLTGLSLLIRKKEKPYSIDTLIGEIDDPVIETKEDLTNSYETYLELYRQGKIEKKFLKYDNNIAPEDMKEELVELYASSDKSLKEISGELSEKYGMNISSSTISKYARKELKVSNRKEAKQRRDAPLVA